MAFMDFRDFLAALRAHGELIEVDRPVAPKFEVAKALRKSASIGVPYGTVVKLAGDVCGPAVAEHGKEFLAVADIPGWRDYDFPELRPTAPTST